MSKAVAVKVTPFPLGPVRVMTPVPVFAISPLG